MKDYVDYSPLLEETIEQLKKLTEAVALVGIMLGNLEAPNLIERDLNDLIDNNK